MLLALLACAPAAGDFVLAIGSPESTCPAAEVPAAPDTAVVNVTPGVGAPSPFGACTEDGDAFTCALGDLDMVADHAESGLDAVVTRDVTFAGEWTGADTLVGTLAWAVRCDGDDCGALADIAPAPCETTWAWSGARTEERLPAGSCPDHGLDAELAPLGPAPWDPLRASGDASERPVVTDATGVVTLDPYVVEELVDTGAGLYALPEERPGETLTIAGAWAWPEYVGWNEDLCPWGPRWVPTDDDWTVGQHGRVEGFDPASALGAWQLTEGALLAGGHGDASLANSYVAGIRLEVLATDGDSADFRLVSPIYDGEGECVVLADRGALSSTGELTWSQDRIDVPTDDEPLVLYGPRLRLGFDGDSAAGGEFSAIVDVRATADKEYAVCDLAPTFGAACEPCADDGEPYCLALAGLAWQAAPSAVTVGADLPLCGADFSDTGVVPTIEVDCGDWDGSICAGSALIFLAPLRRRRRS